MGQTCGQYCGKDDIEPSELLTVENKVSENRLLKFNLFLVSFWIVWKV